jgi:hypothetical protein
MQDEVVYNLHYSLYDEESFAPDVLGKIISAHNVLVVYRYLGLKWWIEKGTLLLVIFMEAFTYITCCNIKIDFSSSKLTVFYIVFLADFAER